MTLDRLNIVTLNSAYVRLTGFASVLHFGRQCEWEHWLAHSDPPWSITDLDLAVAYIRRHMGSGSKQGRGYNLNSLRFEKLIRDLDNFQDILSMARIEARSPKRTEREAILKSTGRPTQPQTPALPAATVFERTKLAQMLREFNEKL